MLKHSGSRHPISVLTLHALPYRLEDNIVQPIHTAVWPTHAEYLQAKQPLKTTRPVISQPDREWLKCFEYYVWQHYADDRLSVLGLAREFAMSASTLLRRVKRLKGLSPMQYIQDVRLCTARHLLENRVYNSIGKVAYEVGYEDARAFSRRFRMRFGLLPSEIMGR